MKAEFFKYHALGNDMIVIDPAHFSFPLHRETIRLLCDRHLGIGADGICYGPLAADKQVFKMRFLNPDGSEAEKSGNGLRIFARYLWDSGYANSDRFQIEINEEYANVHVLNEKAGRLAISMGRLSFHSEEIPATGAAREMIDELIHVGDKQLLITAVSVGNPHCILFEEDLSAIQAIGPQLENHPLFPNRTNVQIVQVINPHEIRIAIWERGAGYTLASGTSASATAGAAVRHGYCQSPVTVHMDGGSAGVQINENWEVTLTGEVAAVYSGTLATELQGELDALS